MQLLKKTLTLVLLVAFSLISFKAIAADFSVYLIAPQGSSVADMKVHVWGDKGPLVEWDNDLPMTFDNFFYQNADGLYSAVYEYHFSYDGTPTGIIFRNGSGQTTDLAWESGGLYDYTTGKAIPAGAFTLEKGYTANVYFYDTLGWGFDGTRAEYAGKVVLSTPSRTYLYYEDAEGNHYPAYSYQVLYVGDAPGVTFFGSDGAQSSAFTVADNTLYCASASAGLPNATDLIATWVRPRTVYMFNPTDQAVGADQWRVHVWDYKNTPYKEWDYNDPLVATGKYVEYKDKTYEVFSYTFTADTEITNVIFRSISPKQQTDDLAFVDDALYGFAPEKTDANVLLKPGEYTLIDPATTTVYFYDTRAWGFDATKAVFEGNVISSSAEKTLFYYEDGEGNHYPVYAYSATYLGTEPKVTFSGKGEQSAAFTAVDNSLFHIDAAEGRPNATGLIAEWLRTYTVYFFNHTAYTAEADRWLVHVWDADDVAYREWDFDQAGTPTGKYVLLEDVPYEVMSYTFTWNREPSGILFRIKDSQQGKDYAFTDGHLYAFEVNSASIDLAPDDYELVDPVTTTIYFADVYDFGDNNIRAHIWGEAGDYRIFDNSPYLGPTGKYAEVNGLYVPVYKLEVVTPQPKMTQMIQIRRNEPLWQAQDTDYIDGALYLPAPVGSPYHEPYLTDFTLVDEIPVTPGRIYFHIGANQLLTTLWKKPRAHFHRLGADFVPPTMDEESDIEAMYEIEPGTWAIDVPNTQLYNAITFWYLRYSTESGQWLAQPFPNYTPEYYDPTTYADYVYDIGADRVFQSYMTIEQFEEGRSSEHDTIYFLGTKAAGFDNNDMIPATSHPIKGEHGVFFREIIAGSQDEPVLFKLSWVDVKQYCELAGHGDRYENQRGWATFNLGLFGYDTTDADWKLSITNDWSGNRSVVLQPNLTVHYNSYNQYGWEVMALEGSEQHAPIVEGQKYWLVVDTHEDDHSVTLVDFDPNPEVEISGGDVVTMELGYDRAMQLHEGSLFDAGPRHGDVYFDRVNVATGTAKVVAAADDDLAQSDYTVEYTVYMNDSPVVRHQGVPDVMNVPFMPVGEDVRVNVRARYTSKVTGISFCSRYGHGTAGSMPVLTPPTITEESSCLAINRRRTEGETLQPYDAMLDVHYCVNDELSQDLEHYADFSFEALSGDHIDNPDLADGGRIRAAGECFGIPGHEMAWTAYDGSGLYSDSHNWAKKVVTDENLPVYLKDVLSVPAEQTEFGVDVKLTAHAVYPFLVNTVAATASLRAPRRAAGAVGADLELPDDLSTFVVVPMRASSDYAKTLTSDKVITGIADVAADADAPAEYYNLQGIRIPEPETPGVYLRRQGSATTKILVR